MHWAGRVATVAVVVVLGGGCTDEPPPDSVCGPLRTPVGGRNLHVPAGIDIVADVLDRAVRLADEETIEIVIFLTPEANEERFPLAEAAADLAGRRAATTFDQRDAFAEFQRLFADHPEILGSVTFDAMPTSVRVSTEDDDVADQVLDLEDDFDVLRVIDSRRDVDVFTRTLIVLVDDQVLEELQDQDDVELIADAADELDDELTSSEEPSRSTRRDLEAAATTLRDAAVDCGLIDD